MENTTIPNSQNITASQSTLMEPNTPIPPVTPQEPSVNNGSESSAEGSILLKAIGLITKISLSLCLLLIAAAYLFAETIYSTKDPAIFIRHFLTVFGLIMLTTGIICAIKCIGDKQSTSEDKVRGWAISILFIGLSLLTYYVI